MSIHDYLAIKFRPVRRFMDWIFEHKQPSCDECNEWIRHCACVAKGLEEVNAK